MVAKNALSKEIISSVAKNNSHRGKLIDNIDASEKVTSVAKEFEVDNAKQLTVEKTVRYFVPPENFARLFSGKNHILLGSRGSGKTTWVRMLAHDHVYLASKQLGIANKFARDALDNDFIGIYVPTNIGLIGSLKNKPWQSEAHAEQFFQWRLNLHSCAALIPIIRSCIDCYISDPYERTIAELSICKDLSKFWSRSDNVRDIKTLEALRLLIATVETKRVDEISRYRARGLPMDELNDYFDSELFHPIKYGIQVITYHVGIPKEAVWMLCIDEAEYLTEAHHRIINTHMRTASENLVFKIATMPFAHHTMATNADDPVREGHNFDYVYVDQVPIDSRGAGKEDAAFLRFARDVFKRRANSLSSNGVPLTMQQMLGPSPLIDEKSVESREDINDFMLLLEKYSNEATCIRARRLLSYDPRKFRNEILRKMHGALILRDALHQRVGNSKLGVYSGEATIVRCSDGNARRLMRLLNALLKKIVHIQESKEPISYPLSPVVQNEIIETIARDALNRVQSEPPHGVLTHKYLSTVGNYMKFAFRSKKLGTDFVSSIIVHRDDGLQIQQFVKQAVQLSLLTPSRDNAHDGPNAPCEGVFHLAFIFSPLFGFLPRRNKAQRLPKILNSLSVGDDDEPKQAVLEI